MTHYRVISDMKTINGETIVKKGDILNRVHHNFDCYGLDKNNRFWTDDFLDSKPHIFRRFEK